MYLTVLVAHCIRCAPIARKRGTSASQVQYVCAREFGARGYDPRLAGLYSQALVGMVGLTGQWWLDVRRPKKDHVAAHLVNLAWNGLASLEHEPRPPARR